MKEQIMNILIKVDEGTMPVQQALSELLLLFSVSGSVCQCKVNRMVVRHEDKDWCNSCGELVKAN